MLGQFFRRGGFGLALLVAVQSTSEADNTYDKLESGPMIGYATMAEVLIWVQTTGPAKVQIKYWHKGDPATKWLTEPIRTKNDTAFVAKCLADKVRSDASYDYEVWIDGGKVTPRFRDGYREGGPIPLEFSTPKNWRFREEGHRVFDFSIGFGSCAYINQEGGYDRLGGKPYGGGYEIFESIYEKDPDLFIWLGDNVYLRESDWSSRTGIFQRWTHDRSLPHLRGLLASTPNYAIWDDHDYGPNNAGWEFWNKDQTAEAFSLFFGNPSAGLPGTPGIFSFFNYGDANFYLLDNRTYRDGPEHLKPFDRERDMLGKEQVDWLVSSLKYRQGQSTDGWTPSYPSNFNIICVGNPVLADPRTDDSYRMFDEEWQYLMDRIMEEGIDGVVFLSGDVHFSEVNVLELKGGGQPGKPGKAGLKGKTYRFIEFTCSPLTSGASSGSNKNETRLDIFPGKMDQIKERNFATLAFSGPLDDRKMTIKYFDTEGELLNQKEDAAEGIVTDASVISASWLKAPRRK
ncbi:MAG: alkaline phosphatase D family protein [Verrucomicrobia bacterium]|nr:alkaline phosphatase D family protein [Verrucomicrobiota bacterium]